MRNISTPATVLKVSQSGENNRTITFVTPDQGIIYATLYGGPKSRLRSLASPFNKGTAWLYRDETKNSIKLTDFDVTSFHPSFSENLFKTFAASLASEILIKSKCAGSPEQSFYLYNGLLDGMEKTDENESRLGLIRFIWRYTGVLGVLPDTSTCSICGKSFMSGKFSQNGIESYGVYSEGDNSFICNDCVTDRSYTYILSKKSLTYLQAVTSLPPKEVRKIPVDLQLMNELKDFCYYIIQKECGVRLLTLESGIGIL